MCVIVKIQATLQALEIKVSNLNAIIRIFKARPAGYINIAFKMQKKQEINVGS